MNCMAIFFAFLASTACAGQDMRTVISGNSVENFVIGRAPPKINEYRLLSREWQQDEDGNSYELILVKIQDVVLSVEVYEGKVWRLSVDAPGLLTEDGAEIGSNAGELLNANKTITPRIGPGPTLVLVPSRPCGISYWTDAELPEIGPLKLSRESVYPILKNAKVIRILSVGCEKKSE